MPHQRATFRVIEGCLNSRRSDLNIIEVPNIDLGRVFPFVLDFLDQNISIEIDKIFWVKAGTNPGNTSADGPVGFGHYYAQFDEVTVTYRAISTDAFIRSDTFSDGFVFIARARNEIDRRQVFFRSRLTSSIVADPDPSLWAGSLLAIPTLNAYLEIDMSASKNIHAFINDHGSLGGMFGNIEIRYESGPPPSPDPLLDFPIPPGSP
jgi:hypothetical protein